MPVHAEAQQQRVEGQCKHTNGFYAPEFPDFLGEQGVLIICPQ